MILEPSNDLSSGLVVQAAVLARLLGIKLLTLDATVLVWPAKMRDREVEQTSDTAVSSQSVAAPSHRSGASNGSKPRMASLEQEVLVGGRLGLAARWLDDSADTLSHLPPHQPAGS
jgi:hypothetical protein